MIGISCELEILAVEGSRPQSKDLKLAMFQGEHPHTIDFCIGKSELFTVNGYELIRAVQAMLHCQRQDDLPVKLPGYGDPLFLAIDQRRSDK